MAGRPGTATKAHTIIRLNGQIDTVIAVRIDDGLITGLYAARNPEKLSHMDRETALRR
jgi:RNA polymerase sigma-70 factor (ECF subfamily)